MIKVTATCKGTDCIKKNNCERAFKYRKSDTLTITIKNCIRISDKIGDRFYCFIERIKSG